MLRIDSGEVHKHNSRCGDFKCRPAVVIDPEDPEQVGALAAAYRDAEESGPLPDAPMNMPQLRMRAALRSLIADPKPEEPLGLGAVVEDAEGYIYVRGYPVSDTYTHPWHVVDPCANLGAGWWTYDAIAAVKVLSEGVTE